MAVSVNDAIVVSTGGDSSRLCWIIQDWECIDVVRFARVDLRRGHDVAVAGRPRAGIISGSLYLSLSLSHALILVDLQ